MKSHFLRNLIVGLNFLMLGLGMLSHSYGQEGKKVYKFGIREEIAPPIWRTTQKAFDEAENSQADVILIEMNTYGGLVDVADSIRTRIMKSTIPVYVIIENNAASAGALISLACDSIYMTPGSTIGAATVVNQTGEAVPDKYQSYMRKKMRATAEVKGRDPDIAVAMVDPDVYIANLSDSGKVLTLTAKEALQYKIADAIVNNSKEALVRSLGKDYVIIEHKETSMDRIIGWLINPAVSGLLIMIIIGGLYFELQSPGIGFPIIASICAAVLYFAPLYLEGMAENWEIVLFVLGLILIGLEIFVIPGFGVAGIAGIFLLISGLTLSLVANTGFDFSNIDGNAFVQPLLIVMISSIFSLGISIFTGVKFLESDYFSKYVLHASQNREEGYVNVMQNTDTLLGKSGKTITVLKPQGRIEIEGEVYEATSSHGFIEKDSDVIVENIESSLLIVNKA